MDDANEQAQETIQRLERQLQQALQDTDQDIQEERQGRQEEHLEQLQQLRLGTYYSTIDDVLGSRSVNYTAMHGEALRRSSSPSVYRIIVAEAEDV
jgi:hypothetical protein